MHSGRIGFSHQLLYFIFPHEQHSKLLRAVHENTNKMPHILGKCFSSLWKGDTFNILQKFEVKTAQFNNYKHFLQLGHLTSIIMHGFIVLLEICFKINLTKNLTIMLSFLINYNTCFFNVLFGSLKFSYDLLIHEWHVHLVCWVFLPVSSSVTEEVKQ